MGCWGVWDNDFDKQFKENLQSITGQKEWEAYLLDDGEGQYDALEAKLAGGGEDFHDEEAKMWNDMVHCAKALYAEEKGTFY